MQTLRFDNIHPSVRRKYKLIHASQAKSKSGYRSVYQSKSKRPLYAACRFSTRGRCRLGLFEDKRVAALAYSCAVADERFDVPYGLADALAEHEGDYLSSSQSSSSSSSSSLSSPPTTMTTTTTTTKGKGKGKGKDTSEGDEDESGIVWLTSGSSYIGGEFTSDEVRKGRRSDSLRSLCPLTAK